MRAVTIHVFFYLEVFTWTQFSDVTIVECSYSVVEGRKTFVVLSNSSCRGLEDSFVDEESTFGAVCKM